MISRVFHEGHQPGETHETDRVSRLVVARDGNVNKLQRSVNVTEGDNADGRRQVKPKKSASSFLPSSRRLRVSSVPRADRRGKSKHSRNVNVSSLPDGLVVDSGVGHDDQSRLFERTSDVVGERTGSTT